MEKLGERLKKLRIEKGLSQQNLSKELNIPRATIASWESGNRVPELSSLEILADYYRVSADYLLGRIDARDPVNTSYLTDNVYKTIQDNPKLEKFTVELAQRLEVQDISLKIKDLSKDSIDRLSRVIDALGLR